MTLEIVTGNKKVKNPKNLYLRGNSWYFNFRYEGKRYNGRIGPVSRTVAIEQLHRRQAEAIEKRFKPGKTLDPHFEIFMGEFLTQNHNVRNPISSKPLLRYFTGKRLSNINPWMVEKYKAERSKEVSPATINRELACLKHFFTMAVRAGKAVSNPVKEVRLYPENNQRKRILLPEEEANLLEIAKIISPYLRNFIILALNTGARLGEIINLKWTDIDLKKDNITLNKTKSGYSRIIPINKQTRQIIDELKSNKKNDDFLFPGVTIPMMEFSFKKARKIANLPDLRIHDLRHTHATRLAEMGINPFAIKELLGHRSMAMVMRYVNPLEQEKRKAVEMLDRVTTNLTTIGKVSEIGK